MNKAQLYLGVCVSSRYSYIISPAGCATKEHKYYANEIDVALTCT